jgi:hypothetical protein
MHAVDDEAKALLREQVEQIIANHHDYVLVHIYDSDDETKTYIATACSSPLVLPSVALHLSKMAMEVITSRGDERGN